MNQLTPTPDVKDVHMDVRTVENPRLEGTFPAKSSLLSKRIYVLAILVVVAMATAWWLLGRGVVVTTVPTSRGSAVEIVYATGAVEPERWARVATIATGRIIERCRCEGEAVKTGQVLARLDDSEAKAVLVELEAREEYAQKDLDRQQHLIERGATTAQAYDRASTELRQIRGLISVQRERLANFRLVSPMDGIVLREDGEVGEIVTSNTILYRIGFPSPLLLVAEVNEEDIPRVAVGQRVLLRSDAFTDRQLAGTVRDITPAGDPVARTYRIRVALPDDTPLRVGMSIEANIVTRTVENSLLVPAAALSQNAVYVVEGSRAVRKVVEVGIRGTRMVEIRAGLTEGQHVISPVSPDLIDGVRVREEGAPARAK